MHNRNKDLLGLSFEQCYDYNYTFVHEMPYLWSMRGLGMANCPVLPPSKVFGPPKVIIIMPQVYALPYNAHTEHYIYTLNYACTSLYIILHQAWIERDPQNCLHDHVWVIRENAAGYALAGLNILHISYCLNNHTKYK